MMCKISEFYRLYELKANTLRSPHPKASNSGV